MTAILTGGVLRRQLDENVAYPKHEPRKASPTYKRTHKHLVYELDAPCWVCGIRHSQGGAMETHHDHFEWASQNGLDLEKVTKDWPQLTDRAKLAEWIDSEGNMLVLCLPEDAPILRPDMTYSPISSLLPGDLILGPDGRTHPVTNVMRKQYAGKLIQIDDSWTTPDHPILTPRGWLPARFVRIGDQVGKYIRMLDSKMLDMIAIEPQVLKSIVMSDVINMMDSLYGLQSPSQFLLHDPTMLHNSMSLVASPNRSSDISLGGQFATKEYPFGSTALARDFLQSLHTTLIATEFSKTSPGLKDCVAEITFDGLQTTSSIAASNRRTSPGTGRIPMINTRRNQKFNIANHTSFDNALSDMGSFWSSINHISNRLYDGMVYDISIANFPTFITNDLIVHNCAAHHRGKYTGIHEITYPAWLLQRYEGDSFTFIDQSSVPRAKIGLFDHEQS